MGLKAELLLEFLILVLLCDFGTQREAGGA